MMISKKTLTTVAADAIRQEILTGRLAAGQRLTESDLAHAKDLSMGTIRVALDRLEREGLVFRAPYSGWSVIKISSHDAWEISSLRSALEALAARLAAETGTEAHLTRIGKAMDVLTTACHEGDMHRAASADFALHQSIIKACGHARLAEQYRIVEQQVRLYILHSDQLMQDPMDLVRQHGPLIDALLSRDAVRAEELARQHNIEEGRKLVEAIAAHEDSKEKWEATPAAQSRAGRERRRKAIVEIA